MQLLLLLTRQASSFWYKTDGLIHRYEACKSQSFHYVSASPSRVNSHEEPIKYWTGAGLPSYFMNGS